jgi:hypothetical protein
VPEIPEYAALPFRNFAVLEREWVDVRVPTPPQLLVRQEGDVFWGMKPVYSPDGKHLAVPSMDYDPNVAFHLSVTDRNGYNRVEYFSTTFAHAPPSFAGWSTDGNYIA